MQFLFTQTALLLIISAGKTNGKCRVSRYSIETGRRCAKPCKYDNDCEDPRHRCSCDGACGMSCFDPNSSCPRIETVSNGFVSSRRKQIGGKVIYRCERGYMRVGNRKRTCRADGQWYPRTPTVCKKSICPVPQHPENGYAEYELFSVARYLGAEVRFGCFADYERHTGVCEKDGTWGNVPNCPLTLDCWFGNYYRRTCEYTSDERQWDWKKIPGFDGFYTEVLYSLQNNSRLISPVIPRNWTKSNAICLTFYYEVMQPGGSLEVKSTRQYYHPDIAWSSYRSEAPIYWRKGLINITTDRPIQYQFIAPTPEVRIDTINVYKEPCADLCQSSPCQNNGKCLNHEIWYECFCSKEFKGTNCEMDRRCSTPPQNVGNATLVNVRKSGSMFLPGSSATYLCTGNYRLGLVTEQSPMNTTISCVEGMGNEGSFWSPVLSSMLCTPS